MNPDKMYKAAGDGVSIQLAEWPGDGPAVLCLHGLTANLRCFDLIASGLAGPCRVLAMDLRGRGLSEKPAKGYSVEHHCRDILAVLKDLGLAKVALLGHSLGAYISLAFAAGHPEIVDKMVLLDGGAELSAEQWLKVGAGIQPAVDRLGKVVPSFSAYLDMVRQAPYTKPWNSCLEAYFRHEIEEVPDGVRSKVRPDSIEEERANLREFTPSALYGKVQCPVLVLRATVGMGEERGFVLPADAARNLVQGMSDAELVDIEGVDHYSILFQPNQARDQALLNFLTKA